MRHPDPELSSYAVAALAELDEEALVKLEKQLSRLANGEIAAVWRLPTPRREPPWQAALLMPELVVAFRRLTEAERDYNPLAPLLLIGTIAPPQRMRVAISELRELD